MGKTTGFIEYKRRLPVLRAARDRIADWNEFHEHLSENDLGTQGARCMDCGIPFCHKEQITAGITVGCPVNNLIPEWNDLVYRGQWLDAYNRLASTNNFPEFTARVCPAPCENSCVLGLNEEPVTIKEIEFGIIDRAFAEGWVIPKQPVFRTGKRVAVLGSGPAGLACADELNKFGHNIIVFERSDRIGGLLTYGIPNMKLEKHLVERRVKLLRDEGVEFRAGIDAGIDITATELSQEFDAIVLAVGVPKPRDLPIEGRNLNNIFFAMEYLTANTKSLLDSDFADGRFIDVRDKAVLVIGGGDTGTDCVGTALRQGCRSMVQFEIAEKPTDKAVSHEAWLARARTFQTDYGQEEAIAVFGADPREFNILTLRFVGDENGCLGGVETVLVEWFEENERKTFREVDGTQQFWPVDVILLAMGFEGVEKSRLMDDLGIELTTNQTVRVNERRQTNIPNVFAAGDCERGQSLIVWAIADGRQAAKSVHEYLATNVSE